MLEPLANLPGLSRHFPLAMLAKLKSYIDQAKVGLPLRLESYNFMLRTPLEQILTRDFIAAIDPACVDGALTKVDERTASPNYINRISSVPTLFEQDQLLIGNALDAVGHGLRK